MRIDDSEERTNIGKILVKDDGNLLLLQTNNINQYLFNRYLREGIPPSDEDVQTHADRNLSTAIQEIDKFLNRWEETHGSLMELLRLIRNRVGFVAYDTEESRAVYTVFECLNSRGLDVDWLDKLKSVLMGIAVGHSKSDQAAVDKISELNDIWAKIYGEMATYPVSGQEIVRIAATLFVGGEGGKPLSAEDSLEYLRSFCTTAEKAITCSEWIYSTTIHLVQLSRSPQWRVITRIIQVRVLGVALLLSSQLSKPERMSSLEQWERVSFRIYGMCGKDARTKVGDYVRLARRIVQKDGDLANFQGIMQALCTLGADFTIEVAVTELLRNPKYENFEEECRYILWRYEEYLAVEQGLEINKELREGIWAARYAEETIEHIFPQTGAWGSAWKDKVLSTSRDRLGNLLLLPRGLNSEAGRKAFSEKKEVYSRAAGLRSVREVLSKDDWTEDCVNAREESIANSLRTNFADIEYS
jgi:hypothetical protein